MKTDTKVSGVTKWFGLAGRSQAYRGGLLRLPSVCVCVCRRRGGPRPHHTAATYVRTHQYIGSEETPLH